jgi:hypothetical protein
MRLGAHMANCPITQEDVTLFRGTFEAAKLMVGNNPDPHHWIHKPEDVQRLRAAGAKHILMRLPDSGRADGKRPHFTTYASECEQVVKAFNNAQVGVSEFQLDNEPQEQLAWQEKDSQWVYQAFMRGVLRELRNRCPNARFGLAPLSYSPKYFGGPLDKWKEAYSTRLGDGTRPLCSLFDFACSNVYWQFPKHLKDPSFGGSFQDVRKWSGLPVVITEWGNSICHAAPPPHRNTIIAAMRKEYPEWLGWLATFQYVEAAYVFILGGTEDWEGFRVTQTIVEAMR